MTHESTQTKHAVMSAESHTQGLRTCFSHCIRSVILLHFTRSLMLLLARFSTSIPSRLGECACWACGAWIFVLRVENDSMCSSGPWYKCRGTRKCMECNLQANASCSQWMRSRPGHSWESAARCPRSPIPEDPARPGRSPHGVP